jgi:hypothetical protein
MRTQPSHSFILNIHSPMPCSLLFSCAKLKINLSDEYVSKPCSKTVGTTSKTNAHELLIDHDLLLISSASKIKILYLWFSFHTKYFHIHKDR